MELEALKREVRILRGIVVCTVAFSALALVAAARASNGSASFDTLTVHRINVVDREQKMAMVIAGHDDEGLPVIRGYVGHRAQGNNADNGIVFYNQNGDEQGGLVWNSTRDRKESGDTLSFDTANTDQLIHVEDGDEGGRHYADVVGWQRAPDEEARLVPVLKALDAAKTPAERAAAMRQARNLPSAPTRFYLGYDASGNSQLVLADGNGKPRIKVFVTPAGQAKLQFLSARGSVVASYPK